MTVEEPISTCVASFRAGCLRGVKLLSCHLFFHPLYIIRLLENVTTKEKTKGEFSIIPFLFCFHFFDTKNKK